MVPPSFSTGPHLLHTADNPIPSLTAVHLPPLSLPSRACRLSRSQMDVEMSSSPSLWICARASPLFWLSLEGHDDPKDNLSHPRSKICQVGNKPVDAFGWTSEDKYMSLNVFRHTISGRRNARKEPSRRSQPGRSREEHVSIGNILGVSEMIEIKESDKAVQG